MSGSLNRDDFAGQYEERSNLLIEFIEMHSRDESDLAIWTIILVEAAFEVYSEWKIENASREDFMVIVRKFIRELELEKLDEKPN